MVNLNLTALHNFERLQFVYLPAVKQNVDDPLILLIYYSELQSGCDDAKNSNSISRNILNTIFDNLATVFKGTGFFVKSKEYLNINVGQ